MKDEEPIDDIEESTTKRRRIESTSREVEVETTRKIEPENTSRRMKTDETTESKVVNVEKTNQSGELKEDETPKKPQKRRKIARKKLQPKNGEEIAVNFNGLVPKKDFSRERRAGKP